MFYTRVAEELKAEVGQSLPVVRHAGLALVPRGAVQSRGVLHAWTELASIGLRRCSAFFAEAAVLVLVFGVLDYFLQRGHMEGRWVAGAILLSISLLMASVGTEFGARRWLGAQP